MGAEIVRRSPASEVLGPPTRGYRLEIAGNIVETAVHEYPTHVLIPLSVELSDGGHMRGMLEVDRATFDRARVWSEKRGLSFIRLAGIAEKVLGASNLFSLDERRLLPR